MTTTRMPARWRLSLIPIETDRAAIEKASLAMIVEGAQYSLQQHVGEVSPEPHESL